MKTTFCQKYKLFAFFTRKDFFLETTNWLSGKMI